MLLSVSGGQSMFEFGSLFSRAQLFEGRLAFNPGLNLTRVSFSFFKSIFSDNFLCQLVDKKN